MGLKARNDVHTLVASVQFSGVGYEKDWFFKLRKNITSVKINGFIFMFVRCLKKMQEMKMQKDEEEEHLFEVCARLGE